MIRDRYTQILRYLHFSDHANELRPGDPNYTPLYKIKPVVDHLNEKFGLEYIPKKMSPLMNVWFPSKGELYLNSMCQVNLIGGV